MLKNVVESCKKVKVNPYYDLTKENLQELVNEYGDKPYDLISATFRLGYLQGSKAERAKSRAK